MKALELNAASAEAYAALAAVNFWLEWNWRDAEVNFSRAIELDPNNPRTHLMYGNYLLAGGREEAAASEIDEAVKLDPVSMSTIGRAAFFHLRAGHYDEAIALSRRMLELEPQSPLARECQYRAYLGKGKNRDSIDVAREKMVLAGATQDKLNLLNRQAPTDAIEQHLRKELSDRKDAVRRGEKVVSYARVASLCAWFGDNDQAFEWLEIAARKRAPSLVFLGVDPIWAHLRSDPRVDRFARMASQRL
ncbi:MAG TPA: hypothetical protein VFV34_12140 [Blastocatellia bacterium]|nr:hypothetical protein [Blastocatellia bacterium]